MNQKNMNKFPTMSDLTLVMNHKLLHCPPNIKKDNPPKSLKCFEMFLLMTSSATTSSQDQWCQFILVRPTNTPVI